MGNHSKDPHRNAPLQPNADQVFQRAREVIRIEADAVLGLLDQLDQQLVQAAEGILNCTGRVVVSGIGKSGHVAARSQRHLPQPARQPTLSIRPKRSMAISA